MIELNYLCLVKFITVGLILINLHRIISIISKEFPTTNVLGHQCLEQSNTRVLGERRKMPSSLQWLKNITRAKYDFIY